MMKVMMIMLIMMIDHDNGNDNHKNSSIGHDVNDHKKSNNDET